MSCRFNPNDDSSSESSVPSVPPEGLPASGGRLVTFLPMDELFVSTDESMRLIFLSLHKNAHKFPPPAIILTPAGAVQVVEMLRACLHLVEEHPEQERIYPLVPTQQKQDTDGGEDASLDGPAF